MAAQQPPANIHSCAEHHHHYHHATPRARRGADVLLILLSVLCPPAVAHIKTGRRDLCLNIFLTLFCWAPGIIHAWWLLLQHPGCHRCDRYGCRDAFDAPHACAHGDGALPGVASYASPVERQPQVAEATAAAAAPIGNTVAPIATVVEPELAQPPPRDGLGAWAGGTVKDRKGEEELPRYVV